MAACLGSSWAAGLAARLASNLASGLAATIVAAAAWQNTGHLVSGHSQMVTCYLNILLHMPHVAFSCRLDPDKGSESLSTTASCAPKD